MMDDHEVLSRARNNLADALKVLLQAGIMDARDFRKSRDFAMRATDALNELLCQPLVRR